MCIENDAEQTTQVPVIEVNNDSTPKELLKAFLQLRIPHIRRQSTTHKKKMFKHTSLSQETHDHNSLPQKAPREYTDSNLRDKHVISI